MKLGLILGDQLSDNLPTLAHLNPSEDLIIMAEVVSEATYVPHHKHKIALLFSAMRHFAGQLRDQGWRLHYQEFNEDQKDSLGLVIERISNEHSVHQLCMTEPGEYRLLQDIKRWPEELGLDITLLEDTRFIASHADFRSWAAGKKQLCMEFFYRDMRKKTGLLMDQGKPVGGQWNLDASNRKAWRGQPPLPPLPQFQQDAIDKAVLKQVDTAFNDHMGSVDGFRWATRREQALTALEHFIEWQLPYFGTYQDAMVSGEDVLFHSALSPYINCGLLDPLEVCRKVEQAYYQGQAPLNAVEGFIRQIIGWREYVRGIYWLCMPGYAGLNVLQHDRALPQYYWSGQTNMHCMAESLRNTREQAYAHHIQRLMVTGNFALLAGISPTDVCEWYLSVYADAYEWVELPNTLGMALHADGGYLGSKPYAASGNYINKMSDYCKHCHYNVKTTTEEDSCPFNSLYWHFIAQHRQRFQNNPRMAMIYRTLDRMDEQKQQKTLERARLHLLDIETL